MKRVLAYATTIAAAVWALYVRTAAFEFIRLDDHDYTFRCPFVYNGFSWDNLAAAFASAAHAAIWMPVTYLTYMLDISWFGNGMAPHHLANVLFHSVNAVLVFLMIRSVLRRQGPDDDAHAAGLAAFLAALLWALHPLRVEPVCWISGRKELLWTLFALAGILCWTGRSRAFGPRTFAAYALCALACMSKPTAMCFPLLAFAAERLSRPGRFEGFERFARAAAYAPLLAMGAATGAVAVYSQTHAAGYAERSLFTAPPLVRLLNAATSCGLYLYRNCVPAGLHADCPFRESGLPAHALPALATLAAAAALVGWCLFRARRRAASATVRVTLLAAALYLASVAPVLGVFGSFGREAQADRFAYFPSIAVAMLVGWALFRSLARLRAAAPAAARALVAATSLLAAVAFVASFRLSGSWRSDYALFSRVLEFEPDHARALRHVASEECARLADLDSGIMHFRRSLELEERFDTRAELAYALARRALPADVKEVRRLGIQVVCDHSLDRKGQMLEALGMAAMEEGRWAEAAALLEASIRAPLRFYSPAAARRLLEECRARMGAR